MFVDMWDRVMSRKVQNDVSAEGCAFEETPLT